jgi:superfamily II DNA or RNA helicase
MIGKIGGGKRKPSGLIDIALIQSLVRKGEVDDIVGDYGHLIIDECYHLSAVSFEQVARRIKARYVLGLSATVTRKDGHHPIIFMRCGPVRKRVDARTEAARGRSITVSAFGTQPFACRTVRRPRQRFRSRTSIGRSPATMGAMS